MKKKLEKMRKKNEYERKIIARNMALITTLLIVIIWFAFMIFFHSDDKKLNTFYSLKNDFISILKNEKPNLEFIK